MKTINPREPARVVAIDQHAFIEAYEELTSVDQSLERLSISYFEGMLRRRGALECIRPR